MPSAALKTFKKSLWSYNPIPTGCVLYIPFWYPGLSGGAFKSIDPFGRPMTITGATHKFNGRDFDGVDDMVTTPDMDSLDFGTGDFSVVVWVNLGTQTDNSPIVIAKDDEGSPRFGWQISLSATDRAKFAVFSTVLAIVDGTVDLSDGSPHSVIGTKISDTVLVYTDGTDQQTTAHTLATVNNAASLDIGNVTALANRGYVGLIGEIAVYNRALSDNEATYWHNQTKGRYL